MKKDSFWLEMEDQTSVFVQSWTDPSKQPAAIIQISHGMTEHSDRYQAFAEYLVDNDIFVFANDHRGHGNTGDRQGLLGYFSEKDGFETVTNDLVEITKHIKNTYPDTPVILLGHSFGSFVARNYIQKHSELLTGVILSGTASHSQVELSFAKFLARLEIIRKGKKGESKLLSRITSMGNTKHIPKPLTTRDWLTRDKEEIQKYINDPYCTFTPTASFFYDMFDGLTVIHDQQNITKIPSDLPILFISGTDDPVGNLGKGVQKVIDQYKQLNVGEVTAHFYPGGRHEMLNEENKQEVFADIYEWTQTIVPSASSRITK
ncbi:alpha/beta hydrolase [Radiobacillus sp. PE A8.2]|uniref:alpha/beta hydrolase n=1 Tax=Radiobacillus sp. PE A8.2 TaxID=3380349 RepID=UPI00388DC529